MKKPRYEGSCADKAADKMNAKKYGMTLSQYQHSAIDKKNDAIGQRKLEAKAKRK